MSASAAPPLPYQARPLRLRELQKLDVYSFSSPKRGGQLVRVVDPCRFYVALALEFDPTVETYVERPRYLRVDEDDVEFSFWQRDIGGRERMTLVVPAASCVGDTGGKHRHRQAEALLAAALAASLPLRFVVETDLPQRSARMLNQFRLLPSIQGARTMPNRHAVRQRVLEVLAACEKMRLDQLQKQLAAFDPADLTSAVADLLHEGAVSMDWDKVLTSTSALWRTPA